MLVTGIKPYKITPTAKTIMEEFQIPLPPHDIHCSHCGSTAIIRIRLGRCGIRYNEYKGGKIARLFAFYRCPKFLHKILPIRILMYDTGTHPFWVNPYSSI